MKIESLQNPKIKNLLKLQSKSRERNVRNLFVVEGLKENEMAIQNGFEAEEFFICQEIFNHLISLKTPKIYEINKNLFEKIAYRGTTGGIIGVYKRRLRKLCSHTFTENPLVVILESVEKPGNLGAVLRTCDGAGVDAIIVCDPLTDLYNPNVIRSSLGTVFTLPVFAEDKMKTVQFLNENGIKIFATFLRNDTKNLFETDFKEPSAIVLGTEATGLSDFWVDKAHGLIKIPMLGSVDSLNVSNAASICIYEAVRQRNYEKT